MARILVIDDSPTVFALVRRELASGGHEVQRLEVFTELPVVLREYPPDAIVLDLKMPGMSGKALGPFIRQYQLRPTPVIIHSSGTLEEMQAVAASIGAAAVVPKGEALGPLREALEAALRGAGAPP